MKRFYAVTLMASLLGLSACSSDSVQETLGLDRNAPDEFRVVSRPPLAVPPEFNLRPPGDVSGAAPSVLPASDRAKSLIRNGEDGLYSLPDGSTPTARPVQLITQPKQNSAEAQFLKNAGADRADSNVRKALTEEKVVHQLQKEEEGWWDSLWSWTEDDSQPVIDAQGEAERIQTNREQGKPVNEGEVVDSDNAERSTWDRIFGD